MTTEGLVSAVIPTYNRSGYVGGAIDSVLAQTYDDCEVVVVNDGSTDDTRAVLAEYESDDRVRVLHNETNRGIPATMNRGVEAARGEFVGVFGDDDRWRPTKVERQLDALAVRSDDYCGAYTAGVITDERTGGVVERVATGVEGSVFPDVLLRMQVLPHSSQLLRTECVRAVGGFDTDFSVACDWDLTVRLAKRWKFAYVPETLTERLHHGDNVTGTPGYDVRARERIGEKYRTDIEAAGIAEQFDAAAARERGLAAVETGRVRRAVGEFVTAARLDPTPNHLALAALSPFGTRGLSAARCVRDGVRPA
ncbi:glycosyltransferase family 2 protein [Halomarina rubra]|uniref:Glycosyltransferase family 2 protein n=1 Tax=Halomarina rubra TaxID=2071873 RepID=A0ABD6B2B9_9EURY|nr:glycosyltransferase [Halomarina rubra]